MLKLYPSFPFSHTFPSFLNPLRPYIIIWLSWLSAIFMTQTAMHNSTCELYKGLIHLTGLRSTRHGGEGYGRTEQEEILSPCLWEKLRGAREVGWGDFWSWDLFCVLSADWWRRTPSPATTRSSLPHTRTFSPIDSDACCVLLFLFWHICRGSYKQGK